MGQWYEYWKQQVFDKIVDSPDTRGSNMFLFCTDLGPIEYCVFPVKWLFANYPLLTWSLNMTLVC